MPTRKTRSKPPPDRPGNAHGSAAGDTPARGQAPAAGADSGPAVPAGDTTARAATAPDAGPTDEVVIRVEDFSAAYDGKVVLKDVNFDVRRGEVLVVAGGSGSGKSTILKHMIGLETPAHGRILIEGQDIASASGAARQRLLRSFGVSFQSGALFGSMTVLQNVKLPLEEFTNLSPDMADVVALTKLHLVGLADAAQKLPAELSGGMQKRAAIARAIALDPGIVFMDEPSAGLDPITSADLDQLVLTLNHLLGTTFVIVSHELQSIYTIATRVVLFDGARKTLVADGDPKELRDSSTDPWVHAFFNREPEGRKGDDKVTR